jgi:hypothetical protein
MAVRAGGRSHSPFLGEFCSIPAAGPNARHGNSAAVREFYCTFGNKEFLIMARGLIAWLLGVPFGIVVLLYLFGVF